MLLTRRFLQCTAKPASTKFPLSILTWNIDQDRPHSNARAAKDIRLKHLLECIRTVPDLDFIVFQESSATVPKLLTAAKTFEWVQEAQSKTYNGYLQAFRGAQSAWNARIAWAFTGLTFEIWPKRLQHLMGEDPWRIEGSGLRVLPPCALRISNIHLDGVTDDHEMREKGIAYYTLVPQSDIIIGDGQYRIGDVYPPNYTDAYNLAGTPAGARYTQDTNENQYFVKPYVFYSRTTRAYVRHVHRETKTEISIEEQASEGLIAKRDPLDIRVKQTEVMKPFIPDMKPQVSVSDHYGLLVRMEVELQCV